MKNCIFATSALLFLLVQSQRILSALVETPAPSRTPLPDDSPHELPRNSAIRSPIVPKDQEGSFGHLAFSPNGRLIAAHNIYGFVKVFGSQSGRPIASFNPGGGGPIAFAPDGKALAAPIPSGQWALFEPESGRLLRPMDPVHLVGPNSLGGGAVVFSPDGKRLAGSTLTGAVVVWDVTSGRQIRVLPPYIRPMWTQAPIHPSRPPVVHPAEPQGVMSLAFSPDGVTLYASAYVIRSWELSATTGPRRFDLPAELPCGQMAVSPDGATLAAAVGFDGSDGPGRSIILLEAASGRRRAEIPLTRSIPGLAFLPNGRVLATLEGERDIRLWDVATAKPVAACRFDKHFRLEHLAISPDGRRIAAAGEESDAIFGAIGMVETDGTKLGPWRPTTP